MREGKTLRWRRWMNMPAATTAVGEGFVGTSLSTPPVKILDGTVSQYADFITVSDMLQQTAPDDIMEALADQMGFRAGFTVDNITRSVLDNESGALQTPQATYLSVRDFRATSFILQGTNVMPYDNGYYKAFTHPYTAFDVVNDPSANGLLDLYKYTAPEKAGATKLEDRGLVAYANTCEIRQSTNVKMTAGTPNKWRTYIFGKGAVGTVSLESQNINQVHDPNKEMFKVFSKVENSPTLANPTGQIGGFVSYKFSHVAKVLEGPAGIGGSFRFKTIDTPSSIVL